MDPLILIAAALFCVAAGFLFGRLAAKAAARRELERLFDDCEQSRNRLLERLHPRPRPLGWDCNSVRAARAEVGIRLDVARRLLKAGREHLKIDRAVAAMLAADLAKNIEAAELLLDYCEKQVLPLIGRVRSAVSDMHVEVEALIRAVCARYESLAARGFLVDEGRRRAAMIGNASAASRMSVAAAPVTTLKLLRVQVEVARGLMEEADVLDCLGP